MNREYLSKKRALELWDEGILINMKGTTDCLMEIHRYIFQDIYDFAGEIRNTNVSKGNFRFAPMIFLESNLKIIEDMPENDLYEIVEKYVEMNVAHPFKEGNGKTTRIWLDLILKDRLEMVVNWDLIDKEEYLSAMEKSPFNTEDIYKLIEENLVNDIYDRELFKRSIQASYAYENELEYDIEEIDNQ